MIAYILLCALQTARGWLMLTQPLEMKSYYEHFFSTYVIIPGPGLIAKIVSVASLETSLSAMVA